MQWMLMPLRRYADFNGRSRRLEYWLWALLNLIVAAALIVPITIMVLSAVHRVDERGGVSIHSTYGGAPDRYEDRGTLREDNFSQPRDEDSFRDDDRGSSFDSDDGNASGDNAAEGDKVSSRAPAADGGLLAYGYSGGYSVDINPFMFFQEFGPAGWVLFSIYSLWALITFIPNLAVAIRRLHDTDRSGWWLFIGLIPLIGMIVLLVFLCTEGTRGPNRFGPDPKADLDRPTYT
jgi:uncharacterized membrane protein YhaH (DUF805 family)